MWTYEEDLSERARFVPLICGIFVFRSIDSIWETLFCLGDDRLDDVAVVVVTLSSAVKTVVTVLVLTFFSLLIPPTPNDEIPHVGLVVALSVTLWSLEVITVDNFIVFFSVKEAIYCLFLPFLPLAAPLNY